MNLRPFPPIYIYLLKISSATLSHTQLSIVKSFCKSSQAAPVHIMGSKLLSLSYYPFFSSDKLEMQLRAQGLTTDLSGSSLLENVCFYLSTQFKLLLFQYLLSLWLKKESIYCPTVSEEIFQTILDLQLNIFYHISPLKILLAIEKATYFTSEEIKQPISSVCIDCMTGLISIARTRTEIWAMLLGNQMGPQ